METIERAYEVLLWISTACLSIFVCACMLRAILGPLFTDRVVAINVIITQTIIIIAILSVLFRDSNLLDIAIVYSMVGFLAVVVLSKCYIMPHHANPLDIGIKYEQEINE
ncbi:MAG: monovalent cation/H+ antiporter complex subunit F [Treponema sp.]|nr:monovalent cation/H+ antiporter complex subunit F [Treponema sp.]